jgi:hypothetical protein
MALPERLTALPRPVRAARTSPAIRETLSNSLCGKYINVVQGLSIAAITGGIAEATYGIPQDIADKALGYLDVPLRDVYQRFVSAYDGIINA